MRTILSTILAIGSGYFAKDAAAIVNPAAHYITLNCVGALAFAVTMLACLTVSELLARRAWH